ncbi:MAG: Hint domain-containing protein [Pseudomonadota bacterium]
MPRISELHYSSAYAQASGVAEFVEVALGPDEDPAGLSLGLYGADGVQKFAVALSAPGVRMTVDPNTGDHLYTVSADTFSFPIAFRAIALVDTTPEGAVIEFIGVGADVAPLTALNGVASGSISTNLSVPGDPNDGAFSLRFSPGIPGHVTQGEVSDGITGAICFCPGTRILTPTGALPVEALGPGDVVLTRDNGARPVRWAGRWTGPGRGRLAPVRLAKGAFGARRPLLVSPQHRLLLTGPHVTLLTGEGEAFVAARHFAGDPGITTTEVPRITYHHLMFDQHEVIWAEGVACESFLVGPGSLGAMTPAMRAEFTTLFPALVAGIADPAHGLQGHPVVEGPGTLARPELRRWEIAGLGLCPSAA